MPDLEEAIRALRLTLEKICGTISASENSFRRSDAGPMRPAKARRQTIRVMVLVKATEASEKGILPTTEMFEAMRRYNEQLVNAGIMRAADGLKPASHGKRVAFDGTGLTVIDGPFAETRELVAGFWLWEVKDMDEAVAWGAAPIPCRDRTKLKSGRCMIWLICDEDLTPVARKSMTGRAAASTPELAAASTPELAAASTPELLARDCRAVAHRPS